MAYVICSLRVYGIILYISVYHRKQGGTAVIPSLPFLAGAFFYYRTGRKNSMKKGKDDMENKLKKILENAMAQIELSEQLDKLGDIKVSFLGKKGELTSLLKSMKEIAPEDRPKAGQMVNEARAKIEETLTTKRKEFEQAMLEEKLASEKIDVTLPGKKLAEGHRHPNTITLEEVEDVCVRSNISFVI